MKKILVAAALAAALSSSAQADTLLGVYIGGQIWANETSGSFGDSDDLSTFNLDDEKQGSVFIALEHPLPLIPNARISRTTLDTAGSTQLTTDFTFRDETYAAGTTVDASFDLTYTDYTLYYELFDNDLVSFDFGITGRDFDSDIVVSENVQTGVSGNSAKLSASGIVPMLYAYTNIGLPFTGFNVYGEGNFLALDDNVIYDLQVGISYELIDNLAVDVNLTAGYRAVKLELDDLDDLSSELDFEGVFAGVVVHF
jgi:outer membrane protein